MSVGRAKRTPRARRWVLMAGAVVGMTIAMTGCEGQTVAPTGDELYAQARELYFSYREVTNGVLERIDPGPWEVGSSYGMEPSAAGCGDGWKFALSRSTTVDPADQPAMREAVTDYLTSAGYDVEGQDVGADGAVAREVVVEKQDPFSSLRVTFATSGNVLVTATTRCMPGDIGELDERLFGDAVLAEGYLPRTESPSDPLFFGITPGEPGFLPTPTPTPTP